jgi:hypothetical protein
MKVSFLALIAGGLLGLWLVLILLGKSGFVHLLLLSGIGVAVVDLVCTYRQRVTK